MRTIIYDVAMSLDGFICGPNADISRFPHSGEHVEEYNSRLANYDTVIMGRHTYEFGYAFGIVPGEKAYPHMDHFVFSQSIELPPEPQINVVRDNWLETIEALRCSDGGDIYCCGGGVFAGFLLSAGQINILKIKLAPVLLGSGVPLFGGQEIAEQAKLIGQKRYDSGVMLLEYQIN